MVRTKMQVEATAPHEGALRVLLLNADGNYHSLGIQILEIFLRSSGISAKAICPGLLAAESVQLASDSKPEWIGISISLPEQIPSLMEIVAKITTAAPALMNKIFLVGNAVRKELVPAITGTVQIAELGSMLTRLRKI